jgi:hypothetical protein
MPVRVDPTGERGPTKRQAAGPDWRTSSRGWHVPAEVPLTARQRVAEAGVLLPPRFGEVTGWGALAWQEARWFSGLLADGVTPAPVPIAMPRRLIRPQEGLLLCNERWDHREVVVVDGLRISSSPRAAAFAMRYAPHTWAATTVLDMAAYDDLVSIDEAGAWIDAHPSYTGIGQARQGRDLADENAWSPREVRMRLIWEGAGFPAPLTNRPLFDLDGRHIGTPDLVDPRTGVLGEYDGPVHLAAARRASDLAREHDFRVHGLLPVTMVSADVHCTDAFLARLRRAYAEAASRPASQRQWTLELPPWWVPTFTVEQRRALSPRERTIWLRHRRAEGHSAAS